MKKFLFALFAIFFIDQAIKIVFLNGFEFHTKCISLTLAINKGIAFSMFEFLGEILKYIQLAIIFFLGYFFYKEKIISKYPIISGALFGAALSNLIDRFIRDGVVDCFYWHCFFDFAIFNFADTVIDITIALLIYFHFIEKKEKIV